MYIFSLVISLLIPGMMIFFGFLWGKHPPKEINDFAGYRTTMSKKKSGNMEFCP